MQYSYDKGEAPIRNRFSPNYFEGNETILRLLADKGVVVDLGIDNGEPLIHWALRRGSWCSGGEGVEPVSTLLYLGASFDPKHIPLYTNLIYTVIGGSSFFLWEALKDCDNINEKGKNGRDALIYAVLERREAAVGLLLKAGADVHARDDDDMTALHAACKGGNANIVKLLLKHGADISVKDKSGQTPTSIAGRSGHVRLVRLICHHEMVGDSEGDVETHSYEFSSDPANIAEFEAQFAESAARSVSDQRSD